MQRFVAFLALLLTLSGTGCSMNDSSADRTIRPRTPETIRRDGNRLQGESSLYLQQHAHNPVDWYPWGEEAFVRARCEDKPIFLSSGYSSCHWCHVMEREVFEQDDVAAYLNDHFVCIKVDREERPDVDARYMDAVQMMTGRGGWPMSVFLMPDGKPFYGGTYYPRERFLALTAQIVELFGQRRGELEAQAAEAARRILDDGTVGEEGSGPVSRPAIEQAVVTAKAAFDPEAGGFRQQQKFPTPVKWRFLLNEARRTGDPELRDMVLATCEAMAGGGLYDHVGGGFHRYTVDPGWTVPHFEKMLYDNAQLAVLYLEAGAALDRPDFTAVACDVLDFLLREMSGEEGPIYASFDADSGGQEGSYYVWSRDEIAAVTGPADGPLLADLLGVDEHGNFEDSGKSVLTRRTDAAAIAARHGRGEAEVSALFDRHRDSLRHARTKRTAPGLDRKIVTAWNGLAITALARAGLATGREPYLAAARKAATTLLAVHRRDDGTLWRASSNGVVTGEGILDDYVFLADGLLELYQATGETEWLVAADDLAGVARRLFARPAGGWYLARNEVVPGLGRGTEWFDSVLPAGNSAFVNLLLKLAALTGRTDEHEEAARTVAAYADLLHRTGVEMAGWFDAAARLDGSLKTVVIAGDEAADDCRELVRAFGRVLPSDAVLARVPATGVVGDLAERAPGLAGKTAAAGRATAYVCEFGICREPTQDADRMLAQLAAR